MTFWSGETLKQRLPPLITGFDQNSIDCAAYKLRMGLEAYVSPTSESKDPETRTKILLKPGESFAIPSGQFAFLLTREQVRVPRDAIAFISMRARKKFKGLVNVSGFHVDPGYKGKLVFSVFNAGPAPIHIDEGEDCFLIWYASLDVKPGEETEYYKKKDGYESIPADLINPIAGQIESLAGLKKKIEQLENEMDERIHRVEKDHQLFQWGVGLLVAIVVGVIGYYLRDIVSDSLHRAQLNITDQSVLVAEC